MDIHRCRFVPFPPSTINALAFSHAHLSNDQGDITPRLAVGRANGDIEIWNPLGGCWFQETVIRGGKDRSIDGLVWTQDPGEEVDGETIPGRSRLFSIGYSSTVTEWDLVTGQPLRQASGNHGEIWCIAAQPAATLNKDETNGTTASQWACQSLIAGCTDGALVLYSTEDEDLQLRRLLVRPSAKKAKIISVIFQDRNIVVAGCTDSSLRIYDIRNGSLLRTMSTGAGPRGGPKEVIIWSVKVLSDGTIVSGDSTGELKIWDGKTYTLRQRIQSHRQDILSLAVSFDGSTIFSGGMDRRTVVYRPTGKGKSRWVEVGHRRFHVHDVKTMASFESPGVSVVVSGGPDGAPTVIPLGKYGFEYQRSLPFLPQAPAIASAPKERLMMSWWEREVRIWRITRDAGEDEEGISKGRSLVSKILIKGEANITSAALSVDGHILAISTAVEVKVFHLRPTEGGGLRIKQVNIPDSIQSGGRLLQFSPDAKWLCIVKPNSRITVARIVASTLQSPTSLTVHARAANLHRLDRQISRRISLGGLGAYNRTVSQAVFSSDSRILAVSDISGYLDTFLLSGIEDTTTLSLTDDTDAISSNSDTDSESEGDEGKGKPVNLILGQQWTRSPSASSIPKLPTAPVALSFRPSMSSPLPLTNGTTPPATRRTPHPVPHELPIDDDRLLVVSATSEVYEFSVLQGSLTDWSRRNPPLMFPDEYRKTLETVRGIIWDVTTDRERVWLWSVGWLWMFDMGKNFPPKPSALEVAEMHPNKKRKRGGKSMPSGAGGYIDDSELAIGMSRAVNSIVYDTKTESDEVNEERNVFGDAVNQVTKVGDDDGEEPDILQAARLSEDDSNVSSRNQPPIDWHTYKYRPILGVTIIGEARESQGPEVAIVERPIWEVDLPPRYYGDQEWRDTEANFYG